MSDQTAPRRLPKLILLTLCALLFLSAHAICVSVFHADSTLVSYLFLPLAPAIACIACLLRALREAPGSRTTWILLGCGVFLWTCGICLSAREELSQQIPESVAWFSDFLYFLYGVPILLAISSVAAEHRIRMFVWMDGIQAVLTGYLVYIAIFSVAPFSDTALAPVPESTLVLTYNIENLTLAFAATLRVFAQPRGRHRRFYEILCAYLWTYAAMAYFYNAWAVETDGHAVIDVLVDIPFLLLAVACAVRPAHQFDIDTTSRREQLARVVENGSPIFYTVALLVLSISLMRAHFVEGTVGIFTALVVYAMRTTTLQSRLFRTQRELRDARDRLEAMTLTDELTGAANRRCFDQTLIIEWSRAIRSQQPLALMLIDIDFFKLLNDRFGHLVGDRCLASIAGALQSAMPRNGDVLARYGGEEFAAILPITSEFGARTVADRMQSAVRALAIPSETPTGSIVTISIGIAVFHAPGNLAAQAIVEAADRALYRAKASGRNRIETIDQREFVSRDSVVSV